MKEKYLGSGDNDEERNSTSPSGLQFGQTLESHGPGFTSLWKTPNRMSLSLFTCSMSTTLHSFKGLIA